MQFSTIMTGLVTVGAVQGAVGQGPPTPSSMISVSTVPNGGGNPGPSTSSVVHHHEHTRPSVEHHHTKPAESSSSAFPMVHHSNHTDAPTTIIEVDVFISICAEPTTFYVEDVCYTATESNQAVTVTNCPCTVEALCATSTAAASGTAAIVTGKLATSSAAAVTGAITKAPATSAAEATKHATATSTQYVTAAGTQVNLAMSLLACFMALPLFAAFML